MKIEDVSQDHRTTLRTQALIGAADRTLEVSVIGRDVWAYQFAKIQLQNRVATERRNARAGDSVGRHGPPLGATRPQ